MKRKIDVCRLCDQYDMYSDNNGVERVFVCAVEDSFFKRYWHEKDVPKKCKMVMEYLILGQNEKKL